MSSRFVVEIGGRVVGLALRCRGGYRFFASDSGFRPLDRHVFPRARALLQAVRDAGARADQSTSGATPGSAFAIARR